MHTNLDLDLLRTFVAFADTGSFTKAGDRVGRTQSAVSMQMRKLEEITGSALFEKVGRTQELTAQGRQLLSYGRRMLALNEEAMELFSEPELTGTVRIATPDDYAAALLPVLFTRFAESYPRVHLEIRCQGTEIIRKELAAGELDMAIISLAPGEQWGTVLRREPVLWATSPHHVVHEQDPVPLALFLPNCSFHQWAVEAWERMERNHRVAYSSSSLAALHAAAKAGFAVTALPRISLDPDLRVLTPEEGFPTLPHVEIALVQSEIPRTDASARLAQHIIDSFRLEEMAAA